MSDINVKLTKRTLELLADALLDSINWHSKLLEAKVNNWATEEQKADKERWLKSQMAIVKSLEQLRMYLFSIQITGGNETDAS